MEGRTRREFVYAGTVVCIAGVAGCTGDRGGDGGDGGDQGGGAGGSDPTPTENEETATEGQQNQNSGGLSKSLRKQVREYYEGGQLAKIVQRYPQFNEENKPENLYWEDIGTTAGGGTKWRMTGEVWIDPSASAVDSLSTYKEHRDALVSSFGEPTYRIIGNFLGDVKYEQLKGFMPSDQEAGEDRVAEFGVRYRMGEKHIQERVGVEHLVDLEEQAREEASSGTNVPEKFKELYLQELEDPTDGLKIGG